ncbi:hypothetical protein BU17DRAFT_102737 [Hysterangium stoloniferum]|nr:hypothetical protein BU17DRAFT_102737 [Hysterangium stoloniferum]
MSFKNLAYDIGAIAHVFLLLLGLCYGLGLGMEYPVISGLIQYTANIAVHGFEIAMRGLGKFGSYLRSFIGPLSMKASGVIFNKVIVFPEPHKRLETLRLLDSIATSLLGPSPAPAPAPQFNWASKSLALFKVVPGAKIDRHYSRLITSWLPIGTSSYLELRTCYRQSLPPVPAMLFQLPMTADVMHQAVRVLFGVQEYVDAEVCLRSRQESPRLLHPSSPLSHCSSLSSCAVLSGVVAVAPARYLAFHPQDIGILLYVVASSPAIIQPPVAALPPVSATRRHYVLRTLSSSKRQAQTRGR